jgi:hypothetical protein
MQHSFNPGVTEDIAEAAILRLQEQNLVTVAGASFAPSRRAVLATLGAIALPLVVSMTMTQQRAYAQSTGSTDNVNRPEAHISRPPNPQD